MPSVYNPAPDQPLNIFFDLDVGGLNNIFDKPEIPMEFHFKDNFNGNFEITVLDETGFMVEPYLWNGRKPDSGYIEATCKFGYQGARPRISPTYTLQVTDYQPTFLENAFAINILAVKIGTPITSTNQFSGTIMEILQQYCKIHGMTLNVNPAFGVSYMQDYGYINRDTTAASEMLFTKWVTESDWAYVLRIIEFARDQQGRCGYRAYQNTKDGQKVLNITNSVNSSSNYIFNVQAKDSVVVAWQPKLAFQPFSLQGNDSQHNCYQVGTGDEQKTVVQPGTTKNFNPATFGKPVLPLVNALPDKPPATQLFYYNSELMPDNVTGSAMRSRPGATSSPFGSTNNFINQGILSQMAACEAILVVLGDPLLSPVSDDGTLQTCQVNCYYPQNYKTGNQPSQRLHYSSGQYQILEVEHVIRAGSYVSVLHLQRAAMDVPTQ